MYLKVKVTPNAKHETIREVRAGHYEVAVKKPARRNLANKRSLEMLAEELNVPVRNLKIIRGRETPQKLIHLRQSLK